MPVRCLFPFCFISQYLNRYEQVHVNGSPSLNKKRLKTPHGEAARRTNAVSYLLFIILACDFWTHDVLFSLITSTVLFKDARAFLVVENYVIIISYWQNSSSNRYVRDSNVLMTYFLLITSTVSCKDVRASLVDSFKLQRQFAVVTAN